MCSESRGCNTEVQSAWSFASTLPGFLQVLFFVQNNFAMNKPLQFHDGNFVFELQGVTTTFTNQDKERGNVSCRRENIINSGRKNLCSWLCYSFSGRRRRRSLEVLLQELRNPLTQDDRDNTADANANVNAMLADNSESDEDVRDYVESHQSLPEWYHAAQVSLQLRNRFVHLDVSTEVFVTTFTGRIYFRASGN